MEQGVIPRTCERCGRLLNRVTGRCVCETWEGEAPLPVATTAAPEAAMAPAPAVARSAPSVLAPPAPLAPAPTAARPAPPAPTAPSAAVSAPAPAAARPAPPAPRALAPTAPSAGQSRLAAGPETEAGMPEGPGVAVVTKLRGGGRGVRHLVIAPGGVALVRARKVNAKNAARLSFAQLRTADPGAVVVADHQLLAADVWQCPVGGRLSLLRRNSSPIELRWTGRTNAEVDAEGELGAAFPGKVAQVAPDPSAWMGFLAPRALAMVAVVVLMVVGGTVLGRLLSSPPAPAPQAPPTTLGSDEVAIRDALGEACPGWSALTALPRTAMPAQSDVRRAVDQVTPGFVEAARLDPEVGPAEAELAWLGRWSVLAPADAGRESLARVHFAIQQVADACAPRS